MLCGLLLMIVASACTEEIMSDARGREITVTASIATSGGSDSESANPSGKRKAVLRPTGGTLDLLTRWQEGDQVMLYVKQDGKVYTLDPVPVRNISADGKSCSLVFKLPSAVDAEKAYTLYGLYGIEGMVADTEVLAKSQLTRKSWADGKAMPSPMWFQAAGGPMSLQAHFQHLGTYEVLHVKNTSGKPITFQQWGFDVDVPWYKYEESTPLREDYDPSQYVTEPGDVESDVVTIDNGKTVPILSWYMPSGGNVSNARLQASVDGKQVTSANTKSSTVKIQRGRAYHMYATWDGSELSFDDGEATTLELSATMLSVAVGQRGEVSVTSGSGSYAAVSSSTGIASVEVSGSTIYVTGVAQGTATVTVKDNATQERAEIAVTVTESTLTPGDAIDLGLPSGTLWASCNVGANSPEEYGGYYAWGETEEKEYYDWSTYKWYNVSYGSMTKYCTSTSYGTVDGKTTLDPEDDVAYVKWGGDWRMPTREQIDELINNCSSEWTSLNGVNGCKFTGPNGNSIFLPTAGSRLEGELYGLQGDGDYWSSSLDESYSYGACVLDIGSSNVDKYNDYRYVGQTVRPVLSN